MGVFVRRTGNAGRNDDDISTGECLFQTVIIWQVARDFLLNGELYDQRHSLKRKGRTYSDRRDVREVSSNTRGVDDIVESKLINERAGFQEKRKRLKHGKTVRKPHLKQYTEGSLV